MQRANWSHQVGFVLSLRRVAKDNLGGHPGAQQALRCGKAHFDADDLFDPFLDGLHVARREFSRPIDLLDLALELALGKGVHPDLDRLPQFDEAEPRFRRKRAPKVVWQKERRYGAVGRQHVTHFHVQHFKMELVGATMRSSLRLVSISASCALTWAIRSGRVPASNKS